MSEFDLLGVNAVRALSMDAVEKANSGHPGTPMALAPLGWALFTRHMTHDPAEPEWPDRDRFVLSAGHASMLLYSLLHLTGYDLPMDQIRRFRQLDSTTPGHPEHFLTVGVDMTTGPLGQGLGSAVGMAIAEKLLAARFNRPGHTVVDHRTWVIASDGDMMEGVASETCSLAGQLGLDKLVVCYDDNQITLSGPASDSFSVEDTEARMAAYGWRVLSVKDVNDLDEVDRVLGDATASDGRPTFVRVPSVIGYGAPTKANSYTAHGSPLGEDEIAGAKAALGWEHPPFVVPDEVYGAGDQHDRGARARAAWDERMDAYRQAHPDLAAEFDRVQQRRLPDGWDADLPGFATGTEQATRKSSGAVINALAPRLPELVGGSADLSTSNNTDISDSGLVHRGDFSARNFNFGVREHAMAAAMNGMALHGGLIPFGGTFLTFSDYLRPSLRMACLMGLRVVFVFTHDSIGLGEDGPTHQPIEHLAALRAMPTLRVLRPADGRETAGAWRAAISYTDGPTALVLSRQNLPVLEHSDAEATGRGAYVVREADGDPQVVLLATGSEVALAEAGARLLATRGVAARVVSMPSWELFADADDGYRQQVLPAGVPVVSVEAASSFGWARWAHAHVALDRFGASAPGAELFSEFGFTPEAVADAAQRLLEDPEHAPRGVTGPSGVASTSTKTRT